MDKFFRISRRTWILSYFLLLKIVLYTCLFSDLAYGQQGDHNYDQSSSERLFENNEILKLTVLSDFSSIMNDRGEDRSYHKGKLYYLNESGDTIFRKIKLKTRGNFRKDPDNCKYPPIMVKFDKMKTADSIFTDQTKLKLVTQCQLEDYVLLEYLAYRINNVLTDQSYRVHLAQITYADLKTETEYFTQYAFFIENEKVMASRIGAEKYPRNVVQYFLDRESTISMAVFQYLIGNDDWYVTSKHNVSILKLSGDRSLIAVPYDFDFSNLVNARYTKPKGVSDSFQPDRRIYKGLCMENDEFLVQQNQFNSRKETIMELVQSLAYLPKNKKQVTTKFIEQFYKTLNNNASLKKVFQKEPCISEPEFPNK